MNGMSDTELKDEGNRLYCLKKYEDAIMCYSKALNKNPTIAVYFTNKALCHLKLKQWESTCRDCSQALEIDNNNIKANFFFGSALLELEHYDESIKHFKRAYELTKEQKKDFGDDITSQLRAARKKRWGQLENKQLQEETELLSYLNKLIFEDCHNQIKKLNDSGNGTPSEEIQTMIMEIETKCDKYLDNLNHMFLIVNNKRKNRDIPDYLCDKISFEMFKEPVITPSGITYERKHILEHLQKVGKFDPVTRMELTSDQLIPNFSMREVVEGFLDDNEWAAAEI